MNEFVSSIEPTPENLGPRKTAHPIGSLRLWMGTLASGLLALSCAQTVEAPIQLSDGGFITPKPVVVTQGGAEKPEYIPPISITLRRTDENYGLIYGPRDFHVPCPPETVSFSFRLLMGELQGVGFYISSGGFIGGASRNQLFINPNKPNGTYSGRELVVCEDREGKIISQTGVDYRIFLID